MKELNTPSSQYRYSHRDFSRHPPYCSCKVCGPVDKWAVYDNKVVFTVGVYSRVEMERKQQLQLQTGRYWVRWDEIPQEHREEFMSLTKKPLEFFQSYIADCPFCGSAGVMTFDVDKGPCKYYVICSNYHCACALRPAYDTVKAAENWNKRVIALRAIAHNNNKNDHHLPING